MEYTAALIIIVICSTLSLFFISLEKDPFDRGFLIRLFLAAFGVRILFTFAFYAFGLVHIFGGADDTGWAVMWDRSRYWETSGPESMWEAVYGPAAPGNGGFQYFGAWFYHLLGMQSQLALACLNGCINSLTVLIIYKASREFFSHKASAFVAWVAVFLPSFLVWSALTVKEPWVIFFAIATFYAVYKLSTQLQNTLPLVTYTPLIILLIGLMYGFRFYAAGILIGGSLISLLCWRSQLPVRAAGFGLVVAILAFAILNSVGVIPINLAALTHNRLEELAAFRSAVSNPEVSGAASGVDLGYDTATPGGALLQLIVGTFYLMFSPLPWQIRSSNQLMALPDVFLWWWLIFVYMVPGVGYCWRRRPAVILSILGFLVPLMMFYAMMFANVGLVYRQRVQLMPFLFILAAAGYEKRQREIEASRQKRQGRLNGSMRHVVDSHNSNWSGPQSQFSTSEK